MSNNRFFTVETEARRQFFQVPKQFMNRASKYFAMSSDAKLLYGILLDRNSLSIANGWVDDSKRVYFIATIESLMDITGWANQKCIAKLKELRKFKLLESKRLGQGKPSIHYLLQIESEEGLENQSYQQTCEKHIYINEENTPLQFQKSLSNNTNINKTDNNKTDNISQSVYEVSKIEPHKEKEEMTDRQTEKEMDNIKVILDKQIFIEDLKRIHDEDFVNEIELNLIEMYLQPRTFIKGEAKPKALIQSVLSKLTYSHIQAVINKFNNLDTKIKNSKAYLQTMIYNAPFETTASVQNDITSTLGY